MNTLVPKFPFEDHAAVSAAAAAAVLASATEVEDGNAPPWRPDDGYASDVLFDIISSRRALSGSGSDGQRFSDQQSIIHTDIGREEFEKGMTAFWRKIVAEPDAFPPEVWQLDPHRIRVKMPAALHGHDMQEAHHRRGCLLYTSPSPRD